MYVTLIIECLLGNKNKKQVITWMVIFWIDA
jgi:hypothetical protein